MTLAAAIDTTAKLVAIFGGLSGVVILYNIGRRIGTWEQWVKTVDEKLSAQSAAIMQISTSVTRSLGREEGRNERKDNIR